MFRIILPILALTLLRPIAAESRILNESDSASVERLLAGGDTTTLYYARRLLDVPYVANTLEANDREQLVVNLRQLDCTTLIETVCALTLCARHGLADYRSYCRFLQQLRYRNGRLDGYKSRLHYFSDWIADKEAMGIVREITSDTRPFTAEQTLSINYMSTHRQAYKALRRKPELVKQIALQEKLLSGRKCRYIPKRETSDSESLKSVIRDGDIIAITSSKAGLDIAHLGFAVWRSDGLHLLNASQLHKKVVEEPMTLNQYLSRHPSHTGIRVVRLLQASSLYAPSNSAH